MNPNISKRVFWTLFIIAIAITFCYYVFGYKVTSDGETIPLFLPVLAVLLFVVVCGGVVLFVLSFIKDIIYDVRSSRRIALVRLGVIVFVALVISLFYFTDRVHSVGSRLADTSIRSILLFVCAGLLSMLYFKLYKKFKR